MLYIPESATMEQLYEEFKRIGIKYARNREIISMIYEWGNDFFVDKEDTFLEMCERWESKAKQMHLPFPTFDKVSDAINHKAITPVKFFDYFTNIFLLND